MSGHLAISVGRQRRERMAKFAIGLIDHEPLESVLVGIASRGFDARIVHWDVRTVTLGRDLEGFEEGAAAHQTDEIGDRGSGAFVVGLRSPQFTESKCVFCTATKIRPWPIDHGGDRAISEWLRPTETEVAMGPVVHRVIEVQNGQQCAEFT
jgi:hypothetical protein